MESERLEKIFEDIDSGSISYAAEPIHIGTFVLKHVGSNWIFSFSDKPDASVIDWFSTIPLSGIADFIHGTGRVVRAGTTAYIDAD